MNKFNTSLLTVETKKKLEDICKIVRTDILDMVYTAKSGHIGGSMSSVEILTVLFHNIMKPEDRFILSKGHASALYYAILASKNIIKREELKLFRNIDSNLEGHPSRKINGVFCGSGSLGQGLSVANGAALAKKMDIKDGRVYCLLGDGEIEEGQIWEAIMTAGHYKLNNVVAIIDYNMLQIDGNTEHVMNTNPISDKFKAFNWDVIEIDGHDLQMINNALSFKDNKKPLCVIAHTIKGKGISFMENKADWHGKAPNYEEYTKAKGEL